MFAVSVMQIGAAVDTDAHNRFVLDFMAMRAMNVTESVPIDTIMDHGIARGSVWARWRLRLFMRATMSGSYWSDRTCICHRLGMHRSRPRMTTRFQADLGPEFWPLKLGMAVTTEIKTGSRRIMQYLLSSPRQYAQDAITER